MNEYCVECGTILMDGDSEDTCRCCDRDICNDCDEELDNCECE